MHSFTAVDVLGSQNLLQTLVEAGFVVVQPEDFNVEEKWFCLVAKNAFDSKYVANNWRPRLIFAQQKEGENSHLYFWQKISLAEEVFFVGTLYERKFDIPKNWYLSYDTNKDDWQTFYKVLSDYSYKYLLEEAMQETADWCGHMSSVVHKL